MVPWQFTYHIIYISFTYQAPFRLNDQHLILFKAEHCDAPSVQVLKADCLTIMTHDCLSTLRSASTTGVSNSSTNAPPSFWFSQVPLSQPGSQLSPVSAKDMKSLFQRRRDKMLTEWLFANIVLLWPCDWEEQTLKLHLHCTNHLQAIS